MIITRFQQHVICNSESKKSKKCTFSYLFLFNHLQHDYITYKGLPKSYLMDDGIVEFIAI